MSEPDIDGDVQVRQSERCCGCYLYDGDEPVLHVGNPRKLLSALAAHLGVELPPEGWRATEYTQNTDHSPAVVFEYPCLERCWFVGGDAPISEAARFAQAAAAVEALNPAAADTPEGEEREP